MNIEIHDAGPEARIQKLLKATGSAVSRNLDPLVESQGSTDRWL